jgi:hypothetical protein
MSEYNLTSQDKLFDEVEKDPEAGDWEDMPEFVNEKNDAFRKIIISFESQEAVDLFKLKIQQGITSKTKSIWYPPKRKDNTLSLWLDDDT